MKAYEFWNEVNDLLLEIAKSFSAIGPRHPFFPHIYRFRSLLADDRFRSEMQENTSDKHDGQVYASLNARFAPDQRWELKRICWSRQIHEEFSASCFRALTLIYSTQSGGIECFVFPEDPRLKAISCFFQRKSLLVSGREPGSKTDILRYVPGRRLTFRTLGPAGQPVIGKFARRSEIRKAYERLARVSAASTRSQSCFSVPSPLEIEENEGLLIQEAKPGKDLTVQIVEDNFVDLLHSAGQIHQHLHRLPVEAAEFTFCHGDFSCSQVLNDAGSWSVVDFDRCMQADPYLEIARFLAFLKYDVPLFRDWFLDADIRNHSRLEEAYAAYLNGYEQAAGQTLNRKKLLWYRIGAEIHYLARLLKRDLASRVVLERTFELIEGLRAKFQNGKERGAWN